MPSRNQWLAHFTTTTWREFVDAGAAVLGFRERRWKTVAGMKPGDYFLCYLTKVSRFIGLLEATSEPFRDYSPIWQDEIFPCRINVRVVVGLTPETSVPVSEMRDSLTMFQDLRTPNAWTVQFRRSPTKWTAPDAEVVVRALMDAKLNPTLRPISRRKRLGRQTFDSP